MGGYPPFPLRDFWQNDFPLRGYPLKEKIRWEVFDSFPKEPIQIWTGWWKDVLQDDELNVMWFCGFSECNDTIHFIFFSRLILIVKLWHLNRLQQPEILWQALRQAEPYLAFLAWQLYALASFEAWWIAGKGEADNRMQRCLKKMQKRNFNIHIHTSWFSFKKVQGPGEASIPENCITVLRFSIDLVDKYMYPKGNIFLLAKSMWANTDVGVAIGKPKPAEKVTNPP